MLQPYALSPRLPKRSNVDADDDDDMRTIMPSVHARNVGPTTPTTQRQPITYVNTDRHPVSLAWKMKSMTWMAHTVMYFL